MAGEEFLRAEAFPAFALEREDTEGLLSARDHDAVPARRGAGSGALVAVACGPVRSTVPTSYQKIDGRATDHSPI